MKVEIEHLKIRLGDRILELTAEEAKALQNELNDLFGKTVTKYIPTQPIVIERNNYKPWWQDTWTTAGEVPCSLRSEAPPKSMTLEINAIAHQPLESMVRVQGIA